MKIFSANNIQRRGFTMMEIAICLAIIGVALVAIIGVLPIGMNVQRDNRQETIIGQDATVLIEDIRNGSLGANELTNYVYAITNYWAEYQPITSGGTTNNVGINGFTFTAASVDSKYDSGNASAAAALQRPITNAANIIGLLSTPEFTDLSGDPANNILNGGYSNHIVAYVYSVSGPAYEKPPQDNALMQQGSFGYRVFLVNAPVVQNTNDWWPGTTPTLYEQKLNESLHELRMTFLWPQLANGSLGPSRHTFRTMIAGQLEFQPNVNPISSPTNSYWGNPYLYVYQSQFFTNSP